MRRPLLLALVVVAGCSATPPGDFGVNLTVDAHALGAGDVGRIQKLALFVDGDEPYSTTVDVAGKIGSRQVRLHYKPTIAGGKLAFHVDARDASSVVVASGDSGPIALVAGKAIAAAVTLGAPNPHGDAPADLSSPDDMAGGDLAPALKSLGAACAASSECATAGGCVDGVCCESACSGTCSSCAVAGKEGHCSAVPAGVAPSHGSCNGQPAATCKNDGVCDSAGACRLWPLGTECKASSCDGSVTVTPRSTCDGMGTCVAASARSCAPYACNGSGPGTSCWGSCTSSAQCAPPNSCNNGCGPKPDGADCTTDNECAHSHCVNKICCNSACANGSCESCALPASLGTCTPLPSTTVCGNPTCDPNAGSATPTAYCNGNGACNPVSAHSCNGYSCDTTNACKSSCASDSDCTADHYCSGTSCVPRVGPGGSCTGGAKCQSGLFCSAADGLCCDSPCTGQCQACNAAGHCAPVSGAPKGTRTPCTGMPGTNGDAICAGSCDGVHTDVCQYPTTQCRGESCGCGARDCVDDGVASCTNGYCYHNLNSCNGFVCSNNGTYANSGQTCATTCNTADNSGCRPLLTCKKIFTGIWLYSCQ